MQKVKRSEKKKFREEMNDRVALLVYQYLGNKEQKARLSRSGSTIEFNHHQIINGVKSRVSLPQGYKLVLLGYDIILENPSPVRIRYGMYKYWIGNNVFFIRNLEQIVDLISETIANAIPMAIEYRENQKANWNKEFNKFIRLRSIEAVAQQIKRTQIQ